MTRMQELEAAMAMDRAIAEIAAAYRFSPGSYTYWAFVECQRAREALNPPSWIEAFEDHHPSPANL